MTRFRVFSSAVFSSWRSRMSVKKTLVLVCALSVLFLLAIPGSVFADTKWITTSLTNNSIEDYDPQISSSRVVWQGWDGADGEIYTWTRDLGKIRLTNNGYEDESPQVDGNRVVWSGYDGSDYEIYTWTPSGGTVRLTDDTDGDDDSPQVDGDRVVWKWYDGTDYEIFTWELGFGYIRVTENTHHDTGPQVSGDRLVWYGSDGSDYEVYTWTPSGGAVALTDNGHDDSSPQVSGDRVVWRSRVGSSMEDNEIYTWTPSGSAVRLTNNSYDDQSPQVDGDRVVWMGHDGSDYEIYTWTSSGGTVRLTDNAYWDSDLQVSGNRVVWSGYSAGDGHSAEIYTWTPAEGTVRLTDNGYQDQLPAVSGDQVVWEGYSGDCEVFTAARLTNIDRYEQDDSDFEYSGTWVKDVYSPYAASGWSYSYSDEPRAAVNVAFTGTFLQWITRTTPWSGIAKVVLDSGTPDEQVSWVDTWHWTDLHKQKVYDTGLLPDGPHTVSIYCTGERNSATWYHQIYEDAFDIAGTVTDAPPAPPIPTRYQENGGNVAYLGDWSSAFTWSASGGSYSYTDQPGAVAVVEFTGAQIQVLAKKCPWYGQMKVSVDGSSATLVDLYSSNWSADWKQTVYTKSGLSNSSHTLTIECLGTKNGSSTGTAVCLDAIDVFGFLDEAPTITKVDDKNGACIFYSPWSHWDNSGYWAAYHDTYAYTDKAGDMMRFVFDGTAASWVAATSNTKGWADVSLYAGSVSPGNLLDTQIIDLYSPTTVWKKSVYSTGVLTPGIYILQIECILEKNDASWWYTIDVDRFDVLSP